MTLDVTVLEQSGQIVSVYEVRAGSTLAAALTAGATYAVLDDLDDFADTGGALDVAEVDTPTNATSAVAYSGLDRTLGRVLLVSPWSGPGYAIGDNVWISPAATERRAEVALDGEEDQIVIARVPYWLAANLDLGVRDQAAGEWVRVALVDTSYELRDAYLEAPVIDSTVVPPPALSDGLPPASSPTPTLTGGVGVLFATWSPITNADAVTYEVHLSATSGFTPGAGTKVGEVAGTSMSIGTLPGGGSIVVGTNYYAKLIAKDVDGAAAAGGQSAAAQATAPSGGAASDGSPPASSPTPTITGGPGYLQLRWSAVTNADPLNYEVHLSTTSGFTPGAGTLVAQIDATNIVVTRDAAGAALVYGTNYYARLVAKDRDGSAAAGAQAGPAQLVKLTGSTDIAADTITANEIAANAITTSELNAGAVTTTKLSAGAVTANELAANSVTTAKIVAGSITASLLASTIVLASLIATGTSGQRVEFDSAGIRLYDSANNLVINLDATTGDASAIFETLAQNPTPTTYQTPALVQKSAIATASNANSVSASWPAPTTPGNFLLAVATSGNGSGCSAVVDGWPIVTRAGKPGSFDTVVCVIPQADARSGAETARHAGFIPTLPTGDFSLQLFEFSGVVGAQYLDAFTSLASSVSGTAASTGAITATMQPELHFATITTDGSATQSAPTNGFTQANTASTAGTYPVGLGTYYKVATATGADSMGVTLGTSRNWSGIIVALRAAPNVPTAPTSGVRLADVNDGTGKGRLVARFPTGGLHTLASELGPNLEDHAHTGADGSHGLRRFAVALDGIVPGPTSTSGWFLRDDATWAAPAAPTIPTAGAQTAEVITTETTASTTFVNLATVGPTVSIVAPASGKVLVVLTSLLTTNTAGSAARMSLNIGTTSGGSDFYAAASASFQLSSEYQNTLRLSATYLFTGLTPGTTYYFQAKYACAGTATGSFTRRQITVVPL